MGIASIKYCMDCYEYKQMGEDKLSNMSRNIVNKDLLIDVVKVGENRAKAYQKSLLVCEDKCNREDPLVAKILLGKQINL